MEEELKRWETRGVHQAGIGKDWVVYGVRYESEDGELAWHTTSYPGENPIHHFWVINGEFHAMAIHYMYNMTMENRIYIGGIVDVGEDEMHAVLEAISQWEEKA